MKLAYSWPQLVIVVATLVAFPFIGFVALPLAFVLYILLSIVYKHPQETAAN